DLGTTPIQEQLQPGSVVLELTLSGRATVRLPLVVPRGAAVPLDIHLPAVVEVPKGFVYVPAGRFLYGSAEEATRPFFDSQPMHQVETGPYLIAVNETTLGEWIAFLRGLSASERASRTPNRRREGFTVALTELRDHTYQLTLGRDDNPQVAREGQPIRYAGRARRAAQDWSRLPVTGVSFDDMLAYAAWLRDSGRVPNARPC